MEKGFHAYKAALGLMKLLGSLHGAVRAADRNLADQIRRAGSSTVLNLAEGAGRRGRDRVHFYAIALGSAREVRAALEVARAWGMIGAEPEVDSLIDRVCAMLWRLTRGPGR